MTGARRAGALLILVAIVAWAAASAAGPGATAGLSSDEALKRLMEGNQRFLESRMLLCGQATTGAVKALSGGQKPFAIILSCSDSRVAPEIIFDQTLGDIFVVRVAGNVADPVALGSIEYAAEHFGSPLIMVLGHKRCGAVSAAFDARGAPGGNLGSIITLIAPAVARAKKAAKGKPKAEQVETAINDNISLTAERLIRQSSVIRRLVREGKVKIVKAKYDLDDGKVGLLFDGP
jgi:carbonic anhydrase